MKNDRAAFRLDVSCPRALRKEVPTAVLAAVEALYHKGMFLDAHAVAVAVAPLQCWQGTTARILAGRLASRLEGDRLANLLTTSAWRESPRDARACLYRAYDIWRSRGPLAVWEFTEGMDGLLGMDPEAEADLLALRARVAAGYRDFELAGRLMARAMERCQDSAWLWSEQALIHGQEERGDEAMAACARALEIQTWFRPAVQVRAMLLQKARRLDEAMALLDEARDQMQSAEIIGQGIGLRRERDDADGMEEALDAYEAHALLLEQPGREWLAARRCDLCCLRGQWVEAAGHARLAGGDYYGGLAGRLLAGPVAARRVRLSPPHVVQKHNTCGPSTLAMLAGFWNHEATHDVIADAICYDGTYDHAERQWCLDNGLAAREFTVTWDDARALLDAGLPFAMATVEVGSAHMQAVIGYDDARGTFIIQDPSSYLYREAIAADMLKEYALHGPRGLVLVPVARRDMLDAITLADAETYDRFFAFNRALHGHRRDHAVEVMLETAAGAPGHRLVWQMELALAWYDDDEQRGNRAVAALAKLCPDDPRLVARQVAAMRRNGSRQDVIQFLRAAARAKDAHPSVWRDLAAELVVDARDDKEMWRWMRKAHVAMPYDTAVIEAWADQWWKHGLRQRATDGYGFAASWSPGNERLARLWFNAERLLGRREQAMDRLRGRFLRHGGRWPQPARTLLWALDDFHHEAEAESVLAETMARHPEDGQLLLDAVDFRMARGEWESAAKHLATAETRNPRGMWLRACARFADRQGRHPDALARWREIADREPTAIDAHSAIVHLLRLLEGDGVACEHLDRVAGQFPHHCGLLRLRLEWTRELQPHRAEPAARELLAVHPHNAWAQRELAIILGLTGRHDEAVAAARSALELEPRHCGSFGILARALEDIGARAEASGHYRAALALDVDYSYAQHGLLGTAVTAGDRTVALGYIFSQMKAQVLTGQAISSYRELAFPLLEPSVLLAQLEEIHRERADLYESWSVLTRHLLDMGDLERAMGLAVEATTRFARLPGAWLVAARVHRVGADWPRALACARMATELNPDWADAWQVLADYTEDSGQADEALAVLDKAIRRVPTAPNLAVFRAGILWRIGRRDEAFAMVMAAVRRFPEEQHAWNMADDWADTLGRGDQVLAAARAVCAERPGDAHGWLRLARLLPRLAMDEKFTAIDRALELSPRMTDAHDAKAWLLASQGRHDEAEQACRPGVFGGDIPHNLQGRAAWLLAGRGKTTEAITAMESILAVHPDYQWGWQCLLDWAGATNAKDTAARARAALMRLAPNDLNSLCEAGDGALADQREEEAAGHFLRAIRLNPGAPYPLHQWLRLCWKRRDITAIREAAAKVLPGITRTIADAYLLMVVVAENNKPEAKRRMRELIGSTERVGAVVLDIDTAIKAAGWKRPWTREVHKAATSDRIGMACASLWVQNMFDANQPGKVWRRFEGWIQRAHEDAVWPMLRYFDGLGDRQIARQAAGFFKTNAAEWASKRGELFAKIGYALASTNWWDMTISWLEGAPSREDAEGWMCANLMIAYSESGRDADAAAVATAVLARGLKDTTWGWFLAESALATACSGDHEDAKSLVGRAADEKLDGEWLWKFLIAREMLAVRAAVEGAAGRRARAEALRAIRRAGSTRYKTITPAMARQFRRASRAMARHAGCRVWPWELMIGMIVPW